MLYLQTSWLYNTVFHFGFKTPAVRTDVTKYYATCSHTAFSTNYFCTHTKQKQINGLLKNNVFFGCVFLVTSRCSFLALTIGSRSRLNQKCNTFPAGKGESRERAGATAANKRPVGTVGRVGTAGGRTSALGAPVGDAARLKGNKRLKERSAKAADMTSSAQLFGYPTKHTANPSNSLTLSRKSIRKYSNCRIVKASDLSGLFLRVGFGFDIVIFARDSF